MHDSGFARPLVGWQRAQVLSAAQYLRERTLKDPDDSRTRALYQGLLDVLEPSRRLVRQHRHEHGTSTVGSSMWEQRAGGDRRGIDRRVGNAGPPAGGERRRTQRRVGRDRRKA